MKEMKIFPVVQRKGGGKKKKTRGREQLPLHPTSRTQRRKKYGGASKTDKKAVEEKAGNYPARRRDQKDE